MKIAVVGSYGISFTSVVPRAPRAGETVLGTAFSMGPGGKGSNQAIAAARLGAEVSFLTAVGTDTFGDDALKLWEAEGVDSSSVRRVDVHTMAAMIFVESSGENRISVTPGALNELSPADVSAFGSVLAGADLALASLEIPVLTAVAGLRIAHEAGVRTLLNPAPAAQLPAEAYPWIDVVTPNQTEAQILAGLPDETDPGALIDGLRRLGIGSVVLTMGGDGALVDDGTTRTHVPAVEPPEIVDTTGAGDAFTGALAVGLAGGSPLVEAARYAAAAGAFAVSKPEVIPGLGRPADLDALLGR